MIGALRKRATIEVKSQIDDGGAGFTESWASLASVWCEIEPIAGEEALTGGQITALKRARIRLRFRDDVTEAMRLVVGDRVFAILRVEDPDGRRHWLELVGVENAPS